MSYFAYLHVHSHYSRAGGPASPADWSRLASEVGYNAIAFADRSPLAGLPSVLRAATEYGLASACGVELDLLLPSSGSRNAQLASQPVVLYARSPEGMANLAQLAYAGWPGADAGLDWDALLRHSAGLVLVLLGGDEAGALSPLVTVQEKKRAELAGNLRECFKDSIFLGLPHSGLPGDSAMAGEISSVVAKLGLPAVAMPTARYLRAEDAPAYEALRLARSQAGWRRTVGASPAGLTTSTSPSRPGPHYLRPPDEAAALFAQWPEALENVERLVEMLKGGEVAPASNGQPGVDGQALASMVERALLSRLGADELPEEGRVRLDTELAAVERRGTASAWLALASVARVAHSEKPAEQIMLGAPLGVAADTLLAYALGLSMVDPSSHPAPYWVLAGAERAIPLPGVEVPDSRRDLLLAALKSEYGSGRVALAACSLEVTPGIAARAAASVLGLPGEQAKEIIATAFGKGWEALGTDTPVGATAAMLRGAPLLFKPDPTTVVVAYSLQSAGVPALVQDGSTLPWVPWGGETICSLGLPAISLESTPALSVLDRALSIAARYPSPNFTIAELDLAACPPMSDKVSSMLVKGQLVGIPYLSAKLFKGWKGGLAAVAVPPLVARSISSNQPQAPGMPPICAEKTEDTGGFILYRDQFDAIVSEATGMDPDLVRRAMLAEARGGDAGDVKANFLGAFASDEMSRDEAQALWKALVEGVPGLLSRSAVAAWSRLSLWSAAIKMDHPAALLAGAIDLAWHSGGAARVTPLVQEARHLHISLLPPDIDRSQVSATLERNGEGWAVLWGLGHLPGWSLVEATRLVDARPKGGFANLRDLSQAAARAGLAPRQMETLALSGACDRLSGRDWDRDGLARVLPALLEWAASNRQGDAQDAVDLFSASQAEPSFQEPLSDGQPLSPRHRYMRRTWEEEHLGVGFTDAKEIDGLRSGIELSGRLKARLLTSVQIGPEHVGQSVYLVGLLTSVRIMDSPAEDKPGKRSASDAAPVAVAWVEDLDGCIELVAFPPNYRRHQALWVENRMVIITGRASRHDNGDIYLLCEHLASFENEIEEEEITVKVRGSRQAQAASPEPDKMTKVAPGTAPMPPPTPPQPRPVPLQHPAAAGGNIHGHDNGNNGGGPGGNAAHLMAGPSGPAGYQLIITVPASEDDHADIDRMIALKNLLMSHPGSDRVTLRIQYTAHATHTTTASLPFGVRYSPVLERAISGLLGPESLAVIKLAA